MLGMGVKQLFDKGHTGCMVTTDHIGNIKPLFLEDVTNDFGKVEPRLVNINSENAKMVFDDGMQYITPGDYEQAKEFVDNPEHYDFRRILNW
jgi:6-phosphofructokinase 1